MDYKLIATSDPVEFENSVSELLRQGYKFASDIKPILVDTADGTGLVTQVPLYVQGMIFVPQQREAAKDLVVPGMMPH